MRYSPCSSEVQNEAAPVITSKNVPWIDSDPVQCPQIVAHSLYIWSLFLVKGAFCFNELLD